MSTILLTSARKAYYTKKTGYWATHAALTSRFKKNIIRSVTERRLSIKCPVGSTPEGGMGRVITTGETVLRSLFPPRENEADRVVFRSFVSSENRIPVNVEDVTLSEVMNVVEGRNLSIMPIDYRRPYWFSGQRYNHLDIFNALVQYTDFINSPLPDTVLPPQEDVEKYIDEVTSSPRSLTIKDQLEISLDVAGNNIVGASNIAFIASRLLARAYDRRAYPGVEITHDMLRAFNRSVAPFEVYDSAGRMDGPGDTYYFWTHFFGAVVYEALDGVKSELFQKILDNGTSLMRFVRSNIARRPTETPHQEASIMGRNIGLAVAERINLRET